MHSNMRADLPITKTPLYAYREVVYHYLNFRDESPVETGYDYERYCSARLI